MSNLSNLYISQSYFGVVNLEDSTQPFDSQSGDLNLQDGVGTNLGIRINTSTQRVTLTSSLDVLQDISGSNGRFSGDLFVSGNVYAREVITTIESSSVIFSSGSNIIGDDITDTQDITGQTTISGSLTVIGPHSHTGDFNITGSLFVSNEISSSTIAGFGNASEYTQSISQSQHIQDLRLDSLEADSASQDSRLDNLEFFSSSQLDINSGYNAFTESADISISNLELFSSSYYVDSASFDLRIDELENWSSSLVANFVTDVEYSASIAVVTGSLLNDIDNLSSSVDTSITNLSSSIAITDANQQSEIDALIAATGSYARLDIDNNFENNNFFSGSVRGSVYEIPISSNTASMDCSQGNFFTLAQNTSNDTYLTATNITGGRTITLLVTKTNPDATITIDTGSIKMPFGFGYSITSGDEKEDVITFVTFNTGSVYAVASKNFV